MCGCGRETEMGGRRCFSKWGKEVDDNCPVECPHFNPRFYVLCKMIKRSTERLFGCVLLTLENADEKWLVEK